MLEFFQDWPELHPLNQEVIFFLFIFFTPSEDLLPPCNLSATSMDNNSIFVSWEAPLATSPFINGYVVEWAAFRQGHQLQTHQKWLKIPVSNSTAIIGKCITWGDQTLLTALLGERVTVSCLDYNFSITLNLVLHRLNSSSCPQKDHNIYVWVHLTKMFLVPSILHYFHLIYTGISQVNLWQFSHHVEIKMKAKSSITYILSEGLVRGQERDESFSWVAYKGGASRKLCFIHFIN